jgi:hypothetical protein
LKQGFTLSSAGQKNITAHKVPVHFPLYVFSLPQNVHTYQLLAGQAVYPVPEDGYTDPLPDELLQPPQA